MQVLAITFIHHIKNMAVVLLPHSTYVVTTLSIRPLPATLGNFIFLFEDFFFSLQKALSFFAHIASAILYEIIEVFLPLHTLKKGAYLNFDLVCFIKS